MGSRAGDQARRTVTYLQFLSFETRCDLVLYDGFNARFNVIQHIGQFEFSFRVIFRPFFRDISFDLLGNDSSQIAMQILPKRTYVRTYVHASARGVGT